MTLLPRLMVAPNGARLGKSDHAAIPITMAELIATARDCHASGAQGLHLHLRDGDGKHSLDAGRYREAVAELANAVPALAVQVTTEAVGIYSAEHQRHIALNSGTRLVSTSIREIMTGTEPEVAARFFHECADAGIALQIILYDLDDLELLKTVMPQVLFNAPSLQVLFVLGRYATNKNSSPADLEPFLNWKARANWRPDWAVCAFGRGETDCLKKAHAEGGKLRVGFENSFFAADGTIARDNAQRVREIAGIMLGQAIA